MGSISQFKLTNVLGTVYSKGNIVFTPDGDSLIAPVGNKITIYDLKNHRSRSLCFDSTHNYSFLTISSEGKLLVAINEIGVAHCINLHTFSLLFTKRFGDASVTCLKFSNDGNFLAVGKFKKVIVYRIPSEENPGFRPFDVERVFKDVGGAVTCMDWSWDSKLLVVGSSDTPTVHVYSMQKFSNFRNSCFSAHRTGIVGVFFDYFEYDLYTVCSGGLMCKWACSTEPELWELDANAKPGDESDADWTAHALKKKKEEPESELKALTKFLLSVKKHLYQQRNKKGQPSSEVKLTSVNLDDRRLFAVLGFEDGVFNLVSLPEGELVQELRVTEHQVTTVVFSPKGEWIAMGAGSVGQLLVWEWQSESYIMKQQGHLDSIQCLDFSSDGSLIVTGANDGKVKLWETKNSFSFHTFSEHTSIITGVMFMQNDKAVVSSSVDGTVRAFDTKRYRNFRIFTSPRPTQFSGVTIDSSSTYVASGSVDDFNVYVWHVASGRLLSEVSGHTGPVSAISFNPTAGSSMLATVSWDKTLRIRDSIESDSITQVIPLEAEGISMSFRPDGKEMVVATLDGSISFFCPDEHKALGTISGRFHLADGRLDKDGLALSKNIEDLTFTTVTYSADGKLVLAGGKSANLCVYNASQQILIHKERITKNRSLDGPLSSWTNKRSTEFGLADLVEERGTSGDQLNLPGARKTDSSSRAYKPILKTYATKFAPTGMMWVAASTEGVLLYSADSITFFNPIGATSDISPQTIHQAVKKEQYDAALYMALRLNISPIITMVLEHTPVAYQHAIARTMPINIVKLSLQHIASILDKTRHTEFHMMFVKKLLEIHMQGLIEDREFIRPVISAIQKAMNGKINHAADCMEQNKYLLEVYKILQLQDNSLNSIKNDAGLLIKTEVDDSDVDSDDELIALM